MFLAPIAGLLPAWGGCKEMPSRWQRPGALPRGPMPAPTRVFETVSTATTAKSAAEARDLGFLGEGDGITMDRDRLLADAKARALAMVADYAPPTPPELTLPGPSGALAMRMAAKAYHKRGLASAHDLVVAGALATVLSGGEADQTEPVSEDRMLALERTGFMALMHQPLTLARIEHTLTTGKPLRD